MLFGCRLVALNCHCTHSLPCPDRPLPSVVVQCAAGTVDAGQCGAASAAAGFAATGAVFPISVTGGQHVFEDITAEVMAQPGDMLQVGDASAGIACAKHVKRGKVRVYAQTMCADGRYGEKGVTSSSSGQSNAQLI